MHGIHSSSVGPASSCTLSSSLGRARTSSPGSSMVNHKGSPAGMWVQITSQVSAKIDPRSYIHFACLLCEKSLPSGSGGHETSQETFFNLLPPGGGPVAQDRKQWEAGKGSSLWPSALQPHCISWGKGEDTQEPHQQGKEAQAKALQGLAFLTNCTTVSVPASASRCKLQPTGKNV